MKNIGIYFGTDTGRTRRIAKLIAQKLDGWADARAAAPLNINRATLDDFLAHEVLILGAPTYGDGELPGLATGLAQEKYGHEFVDALLLLHDAVVACGARVIGAWPIDGYTFEASQAVIDGRFVGLALDPVSQPALSEARIDAWLQQLADELQTLEELDARA